MKNFKNFKTYNFKLLKVLFIIFAFICILNYFVNPYNIFDNRYLGFSLLKPKAKIQERYTKIIALKLNKNDIDTVFLGTSRAGVALNKYYWENLSGRRTENLAMSGFCVYEYIDIFKELVLVHPEVKNLYVGLNFATFKKNGMYDNKNKNKMYKISEVKNITSSELGFSLLSFKSTVDSIWTIIMNITGEKNRMFSYNGTKYIFLNKDMKNYFLKSLNIYENDYNNFEINYKFFDDVKLLKKMCEERNINITFFIMPSHITDEYLIYKICPEQYENWKKELTKIDDIYDFQYPNVYSEEKISPDMKYFFEPSHSTYILGNKVLDYLYSKKGDFGRILTSDNVNDILKNDREVLNRYFKENSSLAEWTENK